MLALLLIAALAYGGLVVLMYASQRALLYPGASGGPAQPAGWGEAVTVATPDGEQLHALYAPAPEGRPTILFFHGNADRVAGYGFLADDLQEHGIGLLALSYRGFPGSSGRPSEDGLLTDGLAAYDWLAQHSSGPVVPLGQSLGSAVAVHVAAERPATALVLISAFDSVLAVAKRSYFFLPVVPLIKDPFRSDIRIARVEQPKLFLHGTRDTVIPIAHGKALFAAAPEPKRMIVLEGFGHNDVWTDEMIGRIISFVGETSRLTPRR